MKVRFWGVRGSIPAPGPQTVHYGGNTTCIEVTTDGGHTLILDAGTGIRALGMNLMEKEPVRCALLVTHTHWDHIQGLPFFLPLFLTGSQVSVYGAFDPVYQKDLKSILAQQMDYCYFPVRQLELRADMSYLDLREGQVFEYGDATVTNVLMNHPVHTYGYRIESNGRSMFFSGDHEQPFNIYDPEDTYHGEYDHLMQDKINKIAEVARDVDLFIVDAQYTDEEIIHKRGWGHGTYSSALDLAKLAGARKVCLTHHDPTRTDDALDAIVADLRQSYPTDGPELLIAREGLEIDL
jgi:phosphoribosyl 1,2-cyclic phosphodiesterase